MTAGQQEALCQRLELNRREDERNRSGPPAPPPIPDAAIEATPARLKAMVEGFAAERRALVERLSPLLEGIALPAGQEGFVAAESGAIRLLTDFQDRHRLVRDEPSIRPTLDALLRLQDNVHDLGRAWQRERASAERVAYLTEQQRLPVGERDPSAHPFVLAGNLKTSIGQRDAAAKERTELLAMVRRSMDELQIAASAVGAPPR